MEGGACVRCGDRTRGSPSSWKIVANRVCQGSHVEHTYVEHIRSNLECYQYSSTRYNFPTLLYKRDKNEYC